MATSTQPTVTVNPLPTVTSISRGTPTGPSTTASSVQFTVVFNEPVTGVVAGDFTVPTTGTVVQTSVVVGTISQSIYTVTVSGITGFGTLGLNLADNGAIRDLAGEPLQATSTNALLSAPVPLAVANSPEGMAAADFNGDGKIDLVSTSESTNNISVLLGNGNGTFHSPGRHRHRLPRPPPSRPGTLTATERAMLWWHDLLWKHGDLSRQR